MTNPAGELRDMATPEATNEPWRAHHVAALSLFLAEYDRRGTALIARDVALRLACEETERLRAALTELRAASRGLARAEVTMTDTCAVCAWAELRAFAAAQHTGRFDPVPPEHDCSDHPPEVGR